MLGIAVVVIAVVVVATVLLLSEIRSAADVVAVLLLGVSLAVAAVPEGLPAILSVVLAIGVQRMAHAQRHRQEALLGRDAGLGLGDLLRQDRHADPLGDDDRARDHRVGRTRVTGVGYAPHGRVEHDGRQLRPGRCTPSTSCVLSGGSLAGNADLRQGADGHVGDPGRPDRGGVPGGRTQARSDRAARSGASSASREIPFTSDRKMMSTIERRPRAGRCAGRRSRKGAPDVLLGRCTRVRVGMDVVPFDDAMRRARAGRRRPRSPTPPCARSPSPTARSAPDEDPAADEALEHDLIFVGTVGIIDPPREEAAVAIAEARRAGIRVIMITGDHPRTAARIAADLGIVEAGAPALTGADLDALDDAGIRRGGAHAPRSTRAWRRRTSCASSTRCRPTARSSR